jgi:PKD repeat protein
MQTRVKLLQAICLALLLAMVCVPVAKAGYVNNGDGTVTDTTTGLIWQQTDDGIKRTWKDALACCEQLSLAGHDDWRLPNVRELETLVAVDRSKPAIDPLFSRRSDYYWTGSTQTFSPDLAWTVDFQYGKVYWAGKTESCYVRCLRTPSEPPPDADFTGAPTAGTASLKVLFADKSTGTIDSRQWDFGDGGASINPNPSHTYTKPGNYTVRLTVNGPGGSNTETKSDYIKVADPTITVTSPNGGQSWQAGSTQTISWTYKGTAGTYVKILLLKAGKTVATVAAGAPIGTKGAGSYLWAIPSAQVAGKNYKVTIISTKNYKYRDTSDGAFTITKPSP